MALNKGHNETLGLSLALSLGTDKKFTNKDSTVANNTAQVNVNIGGELNYLFSLSQTHETLMDLNGDGLPDRVLRIPNTDYLLVQLYPSGKVGLLKTVTLPHGGEYRLEYAWEPGKWQAEGSRRNSAPHSQYYH